ncbi:MAG: hypothetical protein RJA36_1431 [Pseudomonadota bacterium]
MALETKFIDAESCELKFREGDDEPVRVSGYASVFGGEPDSYKDVIAPGAYKAALDRYAGAKRHIPMRLQHDSIVIGKWTTFREDGRGLYVEGELTPGHSVANDVAALLRHGAIDGLSIGYKALKADRDAKGIRTLREIDLREVSIVDNPANPGTRVLSVKKADQIVTARDFEAWLREDGGFSRREAETISIKGFSALLRARDEPSEGSGTDERRDDGKAVAGWLDQLKRIRPA